MNFRPFSARDVLGCWPVLLLCALVVSGLAPRVSLGREGEALTFCPPSVDIGIVPEGLNLVQFSAKVRNDGSDRLTILQVRAACDCAQARVTDTVLDPGRCTELRGEIATRDKRGEFETGIALEYFSRERRVALLPVHGLALAGIKKCTDVSLIYDRGFGGEHSDFALFARDMGIEFTVDSVESQMEGLFVRPAGIRTVGKDKQTREWSYTLDWVGSVPEEAWNGVGGQIRFLVEMYREGQREKRHIVHRVRVVRERSGIIGSPSVVVGVGGAHGASWEGTVQFLNVPRYVGELGVECVPEGLGSVALFVSNSTVRANFRIAGKNIHPGVCGRIRLLRLADGSALCEVPVFLEGIDE